MKILFVHQSFPGQYRHIMRALAAQGGHQLVGLGIHELSEPIPAGVTYLRYQLPRGNSANLDPLLVETDSKLIRAQGAARAALQLREQGFVPDLICGHPGWGELLFLKDVFPAAPLLTYQEFYYNSQGWDLDFDPELQPSLDFPALARSRMKNANVLLNLQASDWCVTPTAFQRSSFPALWQPQISVIHDGINTETAQPNPQAPPLTLPDGTRLQQGEPIVTFVNRRLEPYRGCHTFLRAIPELQALHPQAHLVIVGLEQGVSYGAACPQGEWKERFLAEIEGRYDASRVHFTGSLPYAQFLQLLQLSAAHVYLTYPFVMSWSLLEAMSSGCAVVGSATGPVQEVIEHGHNGLLVDFFDPQGLAAAVAGLLDDRALAQRLGTAARQTILQHYSLTDCVPRQLALLQLVASRSL